MSTEKAIGKHEKTYFYASLPTLSDGEEFGIRRQFKVDTTRLGDNGIQFTACFNPLCDNFEYCGVASSSDRHFLNRLHIFSGTPAAWHYIPV